MNKNKIIGNFNDTNKVNGVRHSSRILEKKFEIVEVQKNPLKRCAEWDLTDQIPEKKRRNEDLTRECKQNWTKEMLQENCNMESFSEFDIYINKILENKIPLDQEEFSRMTNEIDNLIRLELINNKQKSKIERIDLYIYKIRILIALNDEAQNKYAINLIRQIFNEEKEDGKEININFRGQLYYFEAVARMQRLLYCNSRALNIKNAKKAIQNGLKVAGEIERANELVQNECELRIRLMKLEGILNNGGFSGFKSPECLVNSDQLSKDESNSQPNDDEFSKPYYEAFYNHSFVKAEEIANQALQRYRRLRQDDECKLQWIINRCIVRIMQIDRKQCEKVAIELALKISLLHGILSQKEKGHFFLSQLYYYLALTRTMQMNFQDNREQLKKCARDAIEEGLKLSNITKGQIESFENLEELITNNGYRKLLVC